LPITHLEMTRFFLTLDKGVDLVLMALEKMEGGETFVPKIPSAYIIDVAKAVAPEIPIKVVGIRAGEKLHETLISAEEIVTAAEARDFFILHPRHMSFHTKPYASNLNESWLSVRQIKEMIA
jgi:UDP-N-acetylglucosamine 4,6-dehydratase/5-epimerase